MFLASKFGFFNQFSGSLSEARNAFKVKVKHLQTWLKPLVSGN